jgi:hypothetical protein
MVGKALEGQRERRALLGRQADLRGLRGQPQLLPHLGVVSEVDPLARKVRVVPRLDLLAEPEHDDAVEVIAPEVRVAVRREHLEHAVLDAQDRDVEGAAAEVVYRDHARGQPVQAIRERGGGGLVHDAHDIETGDAAGVLGGLPLAIVEVRGHGDDRLLHRLAEVPLGALLEGLQHERGHFRRGHRTTAHLQRDDPVRRLHVKRKVAQLVPDVVVAAAHESLHGIHRGLGTACELPPRRLPHEDTVGREGDDGRQQRAPLAIRDDPRQARRLVDVRHETVRRPEVNADDARHARPPRPAPAPGRR